MQMHNTIYANAPIAGVPKKEIKRKEERMESSSLSFFLLKSLWVAQFCVLTKSVILNLSHKNKLPRSSSQPGAKTNGEDAPWWDKNTIPALGVKRLHSRRRGHCIETA